MGCACFDSEKEIKSKKKGKIEETQKQIKNSEKKNESIKKKQSEKEDDESDEILKQIDEMNDKKKEEDISNYLETLFKSYYEAKTYFHSNDLKEKEVDAIHKCKKIYEAKELLKKGKQKMINMKELPEKITSEFITGYTKEEREKKILGIINRLKQEKENLKKNMDKKIEEMQKMTKKIKKENIERFKLESKNILDQDKKKIETYNKTIQVINGLLKDEYIPVPDYIIENEEYKKEIVNEEIPENVLRISVNNLTYTKSNPMILLYMKLDNNELSREIKGKTKDNINETFDWCLDVIDLKSIIRNKIDIALLRTYTIKSNKLKGKSEISLRNLMNCSKIEEGCKIKMESGKDDNYIDITIKIRSPIIEKEYDTAYREVIKIKKIYPKFLIGGDNYGSRDKEISKSVNKILEDNNAKKEDEKIDLN